MRFFLLGLPAFLTCHIKVIRFQFKSPAVAAVQSFSQRIKIGGFVEKWIGNDVLADYFSNVFCVAAGIHIFELHEVIAQAGPHDDIVLELFVRTLQTELDIWKYDLPGNIERAPHLVAHFDQPADGPAQLGQRVFGDFGFSYKPFA